MFIQFCLKLDFKRFKNKELQSSFKISIKLFEQALSLNKETRRYLLTEKKIPIALLLVFNMCIYKDKTLNPHSVEII